MTTPTKVGRRPPQINGRVAIIAGSGRLPEDVADTLAGAGHEPFVVLVEDEAPPDGKLTRYDHSWITLERFGELVPLLKRNQVTHAVLAGGMARRPKWSSMRPSFGLITFLPKAFIALARGDDALLKAIIEHLEANGIIVLGAHEIAPDLLTPAGAITKRKPGARDRRDMAAALEAARAIGALDIGQAAVAIGSRAVALEGIEGTDGLLERVKDLRTNGRIAGAKGGVLVKCAKPGQEVRADLPAIGPETVTAAHAAGLSGIAVEADRSFLLDGAETIARAEALDLFIFGITRDGVQ